MLRRLAQRLGARACTALPPGPLSPGLWLPPPPSSSPAPPPPPPWCPRPLATRARPPRPPAPAPPPPPGAATRPANDAVAARRVRLVRPDGTHEVLWRADALEEARAAGLDLVLVDAHAQPYPVCRLSSVAAMRESERVREKAARRKAVGARAADLVKEVRVTGVRISDHDLRVKAAAGGRALAAGHRVKLSVAWRSPREAGEPGARAAAAALLERLQALLGDLHPHGMRPRLDAAPKAEGMAMVWCRVSPAPAAPAAAGASGQQQKRPPQERAVGATEADDAHEGAGGVAEGEERVAACEGGLQPG